MIVKHQLVIISLYHVCATEIPYDTSCWKSNLSLIYALQISLMERDFPKPTFIELEIIGDVHLPLQIAPDLRWQRIQEIKAIWTTRGGNILST
jgi:hypothetical protein